MSGVRLRTISLAIVIATSVAGCTGGTATPANETLITTPPPTAEPASTMPAATDDVASPPVAMLAAEGGDAVGGQLGTYIWAGGGSDSPWLPGAPITVGAKEPLIVAFQPTIDLASWTARSVASGATDPAGARSLGQGSGTARFEAPTTGSWTIEVHVEFADGAGSASYFWLVTVL